MMIREINDAALLHPVFVTFQLFSITHTLSSQLFISDTGPSQQVQVSK